MPRAIPAQKPLTKREQATEIFDKLGFDPIFQMVKRVQGRAECPLCQGTGYSKYQPGEMAVTDDPRGVPCKPCSGGGLEFIDSQERTRLLMELAQYKYFKLKAMEITGDGGGAITVSLAEAVRKRRAARQDAVPNQ